MQFATLLINKVLAWATAIWYQGGAHLASYEQFFQLYRAYQDDQATLDSHIRMSFGIEEE